MNIRHKKWAFISKIILWYKSSHLAFYFYIDLPDGYAVKYQIESERYDASIQWGDNSFLPKQTIVTQKVSVKMTIVKSDAAKFPWGQKVLAVLNQKATFDSVLTEEK